MITSFDCSFENAQGNLADSKRWATKPIGATRSLRHLNSVARFLPPSRKYKHLEEKKLCRHVGEALPRVSTNSRLSKIYQGALGGTNSCSTHPPQGALLTLPFLQGPCYRNTSQPCKGLSGNALFALAGEQLGQGAVVAGGTRCTAPLCSRTNIPVQGTKQPGGRIIQLNCHRNPGHPTCSNQCPGHEQGPLRFSPGQEELRKALTFPKKTEPGNSGRLRRSPPWRTTVPFTRLYCHFILCLRPCFCIRLCAGCPKLAAYKYVYLRI